MTLENLLAIHKLVELAPDRGRLLAAADRNLADAGIELISDENRFDAAYKCILQCAMAALWAKGYRTSTSQPGHHQTALQTLTKTIGLEASATVLLDALRKQRNLSDYDGNPISPAAVADCLQQAQALSQRVRQWLRDNHPDLC